MQTKPIRPSCQSVLVEVNVRWLRQALQLLERMDDRSYATEPALAPHRAGAHLRHILEFYQCFLEGLELGRIDYDARRRNHAVEHSRRAAAEMIHSLICALETHHAVREGRTVGVRMEDADPNRLRDSFMESSVSRELQALSSHTVHHFALIAVTLRLHGVTIEPDFGMALSTLRYLASGAAEAA